MSLALLTLSLLAASPTQAQSYPGGGAPGSGYPGPGGYPPGGHYWQVTYQTQGAVTDALPDNPAPGQSAPQTFPWNPNNSAGAGNLTNINTATGGIVTATLTWVPALGNPTDQPSEPVYVKLISSADESPYNWNGLGSAPSGVGTVDDGFDDPWLPYRQGYISSGIHLLKKDGSSGVITLGPYTLSALTPTSTWQQPYPNYPSYHYWDWLGGMAGVSFNAGIDTDPNPRAVTISANVDPTYYKVPDANNPVDDNGDPNYYGVAHVPAADGTMSGDVGLPITPYNNSGAYGALWTEPHFPYQRLSQLLLVKARF